MKSAHSVNIDAFNPIVKIEEVTVKFPSTIHIVVPSLNQGNFEINFINSTANCSKLQNTSVIIEYPDSNCKASSPLLNGPIIFFSVTCASSSSTNSINTWIICVSAILPAVAIIGAIVAIVCFRKKVFPYRDRQKATLTNAERVAASY